MMTNLSYVRLLPCALLCLCGQESLAQTLSIDFDATIEQTTCSMTVESLGTSRSSGDPVSGYLLTIPDMSVLDIVNKTSNAEGSFKLLPTECNYDEISKITMTISGNSGSSAYRISNNTSIEGYAQNTELGFKLKDTQDTQHLKLNGEQQVTWTSEQITNGLELTAFIRKVSGDSSPVPVAGEFQAKATFVFTYQ
jgi:P pilus assembly protein, pilin FimA